MSVLSVLNGDLILNWSQRLFQFDFISFKVEATTH